MNTFGLDEPNARDEFYRQGAPEDPIEEARKRGGTHWNQSLGRSLMPQSHMPVGEHLGKIMERVPERYLRWVDSQPWAQEWPQWQPVRDYLERFPVAAGEGLGPVALLIDPDLVPEDLGGTPILTTNPGTEDLLHAFAQGAVDLHRTWGRKHRLTGMPYYRLKEQQLSRALLHGAERVSLVRPVRKLVRAWQQKAADCTRKGFASEELALIEAESRNTSPFRRYRQGKGHRTQEAYHCEVCQFWHLRPCSDHG